MKISRAIVTLLAAALAPRRDAVVAGEGLRGLVGAGSEPIDDPKMIADILANFDLASLKSSPGDKVASPCSIVPGETISGGFVTVSTGESGAFCDEAGTLTGTATVQPTSITFDQTQFLSLPDDCAFPTEQVTVDYQVSAGVPVGKEASLSARVTLTETRLTRYIIMIQGFPLVYATETIIVPTTAEGVLEDVEDCDKNDPGSMDDPHIFTWKGIIYNYHGQCDLIYTTCPSFDNNKGLRIHMRTKFVMPEEWSTITNLAVQIGEDTFELQNDGIYHVNGEANPALSDTANLAGHEMKQATRHNGHNFSIALGDGMSLEVANYVRETRNSLAFKITGVHDHRDNAGTSLSDCIGLTSTWDHPEDHRFLVGRSGTLYSAAKRAEFGPEWQVDLTKGDPMLFAEDVGQQLPDQRCVDSKDDLGHRRLLDDAEAEVLGRQAEDACRHLHGRNKDLFEACVSDILVTGDLSFAEEPWYNGGDEF